ncbi:MAG TPA: M1 family aminopeptidase, partial [Thermoanaerobaculia bacterium]|nr:M1 family aminopeptidase [Thermoanaerobaculia bacterium]
EAERRQLAIWTGDDKLMVLRDGFDSAVFFGLALPNAPKSSPPSAPAKAVYEAFLVRQRKEFATNFHLRIAQDLYNHAAQRAFIAFIDGRRLPPALLVVDPLGALPMAGGEETMLFVEDEVKRGVWYSSHLRGGTSARPPLADAERYEIETTIAPDGEVAGVTTVTLMPSMPLRLLPLNLAPQLRLQSVTYGGKEAQFIQEAEDADAAIVFPEAIRRKVAITLTYKGRGVLTNAGDGNFTVGARTNWYPSFGTFADLAGYELRFRVPRGNEVVSVGREVEDVIDGEQRVSVWRSEHPLRVAGFNYGRFEKISGSDPESGTAVDVYTNPGTPDVIRKINGLLEGGVRVDTAALARAAMNDALDTARIGTRWFGPLPSKRVSITQQSEWFFGQSWPTLVYLPYVAFLDGPTRQALHISGAADFIDAVGLHELAHQWFGHEVGWRGYRDQWLSEGFAEFTAGLVIEERGGWKAASRFWEKKRRHVLDTPRGALMASADAGPISQGWRVATWRNRAADDAILYSKGAYVLHMLRMQMWDASKKDPDEDFKAMMKDFVAAYAGRNPSTADFQRVAERHLTPQLRAGSEASLDWFFRQWVYGTAIPRYSADLGVIPLGGDRYRVTGSITQSEVPEGFLVVMPIYLRFDEERVVRLGATTLVGNTTKEVSVELTLPRRPIEVGINLNHDVLAR